MGVIFGTVIVSDIREVIFLCICCPIVIIYIASISYHSGYRRFTLGIVYSLWYDIALSLSYMLCA